MSRTMASLSKKSLTGAFHALALHVVGFAYRGGPFHTHKRRGIHRTFSGFNEHRMSITQQDTKERKLA
jgi:hypothetical protein